MQSEADSLEKKSGKKKVPKIPTVQDVMLEEGTDSAESTVPETSVSDGIEPSESSSEMHVETGNESAVVESEKTDSDLDSEDDFEASEQEKIESRRANMNLDSETALLETVLFLESDPQTPENLAKITQMDLETVNQCVELLKEKYGNADSGIELSLVLGGWMLTPKMDSFNLVKERYGKKNEGRLSKAAIETLSIIAYSQPITRAEIESIRHVSADNMIRILLDRKFIKEGQKKDIPGKPVTYGTTKEFLEFFHLQSIADLPQLDEKESERFDLAR